VVAARITREELVRQLGSTVGDIKAEQAISTEALGLGLYKLELEIGDAIRLLDRVATLPGIVGIAAQLMRARVLLRR
jgi:hypothetical protein